MDKIYKNKMGNFGFKKDEDQQDLKEPKMAAEKLDIPSDTKEQEKEKEEPKETQEHQQENPEEESPQPIIKVDEGEQQNEENNEEQNEEQIEEQNEEQNEEQIEEQNEEQMEEQNEEQIEEQNEEQIDEPINEQNEVLKTPQKGKPFRFTQNGQLYQVDEKGQLYRIIIDQKESSLDQQSIEIPQNYQILQRENGENKEISESYEVNQDQNINNIKYHDIAFRSSKKGEQEQISNLTEQNITTETQGIKRISFGIKKRKEPKDSNPKVHIISKKKKESIKYIKNTPKDQENTIVVGNGMVTGEYKFIGEKTFIKENIVPNENMEINQEEIIEELNKRKNKKKEKKIKYEIIDKFYTLTNITGKTIKKLEKTGIKGQRNYFYETLYTSNINTNINMNIPMQYNNINNMSNMTNMNTLMPSDNYSRYMLSQINKIRTEPQSFIGVIEDSKSNIIKDRFGRIIYNGKIRVALNIGERAFDEAINYLKDTRPMKPLMYNQMLTVNAPLTEEEIIDKSDLSKKVEIITHMGVNIRSFWRDVIKDPEISFLLMIIDDNGIKSGMRRKDILCPYMKNIGITSSEINNNFVCYITLA